MESSSFSFGESGADQLIARRLDPEPPEFDITAMVDLVFMMTIYFLVTFITVAMGELNLPAARHVSALDAESEAEIKNHIWFSGISFTEQEEPEIVVVVYLRFSEAGGKEAAPLAAAVVACPPPLSSILQRATQRAAQKRCTTCIPAPLSTLPLSFLPPSLICARPKPSKLRRAISSTSEQFELHAPPSSNSSCTEHLRTSTKLP